MINLSDEITETVKLIQDTPDVDVRDSLRGHLDGLLELRRHHLALGKKVDIRLGDLVLQKPGIHSEE